jgi:hypothetical protein
LATPAGARAGPKQRALPDRLHHPTSVK